MNQIFGFNCVGKKNKPSILEQQSLIFQNVIHLHDEKKKSSIAGNFSNHFSKYHTFKNKSENMPKLRVFERGEIYIYNSFISKHIDRLLLK